MHSDKRHVAIEAIDVPVALPVRGEVSAANECHLFAGRFNAVISKTSGARSPAYRGDGHDST